MYFLKMKIIFCFIVNTEKLFLASALAYATIFGNVTILLQSLNAKYEMLRQQMESVIEFNSINNVITRFLVSLDWICS